MEIDMAEVKDFMLDDSMSIDDIDDMPGFEAIPAGQYKFALNEGIISDALPDGRAIFRMPATIMEVLGIVDDTITESEHPKPGQEVGFMFMRTTKFGAANYKAVAKVISEVVGSKVVSEINEGSKGVELIILVSKTQNKKDKTRWNNNIVDVALAA
jgi:hypothetical protein